jgi:type I restriction enzyme, S subunit
MSNELPTGWAESTIGNCFFEIRNGTTAPQNKFGKGVPVTRIETIQNNKFDLARVHHVENPTTELIEIFRYQHGDIALSHINSLEHVGKTALYEGAPEVLLHGMNLLRLRVGQMAIDPRFAHLFMKTDLFRNEVRERVGHAVNQVSINQKNLAQVPFIVAPLPEQRRIILKLGKLLDKVDACQHRLPKILTLLKRFRQSVLAAACSGRLTADWREDNPAVDIVVEILNAIRIRREAAAKVHSLKEKIRHIYEVSEENNSNELPECWQFVTLNNLCVSLDYGTSAKSQPSGKVPVLRMGNIQNGKLDWDDLVYTSDADEIQSYSLKPYTVLFNRTNSPELVGKTAIYRGEHPAIFAGYLIRINTFPELDPQYRNLCLNTSYAKEFFLHVKTDGVSQSNINAQKLGTFEVPFCNPDEQREIVRRVDALFALANQIEARFATAKARVDQLTQSLLAKAFSGNLVPQDPNDEPASVLLERIKAERTKGETEAKGGGKKRLKVSRKGKGG